MLISAKNIVLPHEVALPLSKSESNRALMIMHYAEAQSHKVVEPQSMMSDSDDTVLLQKHLNKINQYVNNCEKGLSSADCCPLTLDCANAGTVFRFLMTAVATQCTMNNLQFTIDSGQSNNFLRFSDSQILRFFLTGSERMKQRPIDSLVDALRNLGVSIEYTEKEGFPPVLIKAPMNPTDDTDYHRLCHRQKDNRDTRDPWSDIINSPTDDTDYHRLCYRQKDTCDTRDPWRYTSRTPWRLEISAEQSSQFASSLLLAAPLFENGLELHLTGNISSLPYIDMTINMMRQCGIDVVRNERDIIVKSGTYNIENLKIEPDWSAAAFWYEIVALSDNSEVLLKNLNINSLQADAVAMKMFKDLGVETIAVKDGIVIRKSTSKSLSSKVLVQQSIAKSLSSKALVQKPTATFNFQHSPDLFPAVIATCAGLGLDAEFSGLKNLSIKESDRKKAMMNELRKINISFEETSDDILRMSCPKELPYFNEENPIVFNNYGDHRIAMALSILSIKIGAISMENTEVVSKSYPNFFEELIVKPQNLKNSESQNFF